MLRWTNQIRRFSNINSWCNKIAVNSTSEETLTAEKESLNEEEYTIFETEQFHNPDLLADYLDLNYGVKFREYIKIKVIRSLIRILCTIFNVRGTLLIMNLLVLYSRYIIIKAGRSSHSQCLMEV